MGLLSAAFLVTAVLDFAILIWALRLYRKFPSTAQWLATTPLGLLWYDNFVIGIGSTLGEGDLLIAMNVVRFLGHYILLPLTFIALGSMAKQAGFKWAQPKFVIGGFCLLATYFMLDDLWRFYNATLYPSCFADTLRYTTRITDYTACSADSVIGAGKAIPPIPAITMSNMMILFGAYLWWKIGYKWLFLGATGALVFFAIPYSKTGGIFSNIGEPIISVVILLAAAHITQYVNQRDTQPEISGSVVQK
jgi:hypothetical protein